MLLSYGCRGYKTIGEILCSYGKSIDIGYTPCYSTGQGCILINHYTMLPIIIDDWDINCRRGCLAMGYIFKHWRYCIA